MKHKIETPAELIKKVSSVTAEDVRKLAMEVFVDEGLNMAVIGRYKDGEAFRPYFKFG
jgi:hypothetical protein